MSEYRFIGKCVLLIAGILAFLLALLAWPVQVVVALALTALVLIAWGG